MAVAVRKRIYIDFSYLIVLAASFGAVIILGTVVAPVVIHSDKILVDIALDQYNSGIIMGEVFHRFSSWLYIVASVVAVYELIMYKAGQRDSIIFASAITVVFSSLMFSAVYSPKILSMQTIGIEATQSDTLKIYISQVNLTLKYWLLV